MTNIPERLLKQKWLKEWHHPHVLDYITTGNPAALQKIPAISDSGTWWIRELLPFPPDWSPEADRIMRIASRFGLKTLVSYWIGQFCNLPDSKWEHFHPALEILKNAGAHQSLTDFCLMDQSMLFDLAQARPTPAGLLLIDYDDEKLKALFQSHFGRVIGHHKFDECAAVLASRDPDRLDALLASEWGRKRTNLNWAMILSANHDRYHLQAREAYGKDKQRNPRLAFILAKAQPQLYREWAIDELLTICRRFPEEYFSREAVEFLLQLDAPDTFGPINLWMSDAGTGNPWNTPFQREMILKIYRETFPERVMPAIQAMSRGSKPILAAAGLKLWKAEGIGENRDLYLDGIRRLLASGENPWIIHGLKEAAIDPAAFEAELWTFMEHKSAPVRSAATRTLSGIGFAGLREKAGKQLHSQKADLRISAVILLQRGGGAEAAPMLKERLETEESEAVRDAILLALEGAGGLTLTPEERAARMARTLAGAKGSPAGWLDPGKLVLVRKDGARLSPDEILYLLLRQSRCSEMRADIEARPLIESLDRAGCAPAALQILEGFLDSGQDKGLRWTLALASLCGDDRLVPPLHKAILNWSANSRGKLAEFATGALALLGTDSALTVLESLTVRFRSKNKNIGQAAGDAFQAAAAARGVSVEELGDRVVPWLGFEPGIPKVITGGGKNWETWIGPDFKPVYRETGSSKKLTKLPAAAGAAVLEEQKILTASLKEAAKAQLLRMETLLVRQFQWPADRWRELYLGHPLLRPFAEQLIWRHHPDKGAAGPPVTFRSLGDGGLTNAAGDPFHLPETGQVSLLHPLDLTVEGKEEWSAHLEDYAILPPFPQLERPVLRCPESEAVGKFLGTVRDSEINAMTFRGRAEKLGWARGSVCDGGGVTTYRKLFSGTAVEALLFLEGMYVGIGPEDSITLGEVCFTAAGSVKTGSYTYDEPSGPDDPRLIPLGQVPAVPFSEVMADLHKITGKSPAPADTPDAPA